MAKWKLGLFLILHFHKASHEFTIVLAFSLLIITAYIRFTLHYTYIANSSSSGLGSVYVYVLLQFDMYDIVSYVSCRPLTLTWTLFSWFCDSVWIQFLALKYSLSLRCFCLLSLRIVQEDQTFVLPSCVPFTWVVHMWWWTRLFLLRFQFL